MADISTVVIEYIVGDKELEHILQKLNIPVVSILPSEIDIDVIAYQIKPDIILINTRKVNTKIVTFILDINQVYERPIILFSDDPDIQSVNKVIKSGVSAYIVSGLESKRIKSIIDIAVARFNELSHLKDELQKTKAQLEDRKLIDKAKGILMQTRGFSEEEAYHTLRKLAMDRSIAVGEMAKNVIAMAELLG